MRLSRGLPLPGSGGEANGAFPTPGIRWWSLAMILAGIFLSYSGHGQNRAEYFFDTDPGTGQGVALTAQVGDSVVINQSISVNSLTAGFHTLYLRTRMGGRWSQAASSPLFIVSIATGSSGPITRVEYFFDNDPGPGNGSPVTITSVGATDSLTQNAVIPISQLSSGFHTLYVRTRNNRGYSLTEARTFFIVSPSALNAGPVSQLEYFFDIDPGVGLATRINVSPAADSSVRTAIIPISSLTSGFHTLYVRAKNNNGYSLTESRTFFIVSPNTFNAGPITSMEYFFDTDPGVGQGTRIAVSPSADSAERTATIPISQLSSGFHTLYIRPRNQGGFGLTEARTFFILPSGTTNAGPVTRMEYFIDTDPGVGLGTPLSPAFSAGDSVDLTRTIVLPSTIAQGAHKLYIRSQTQDKRWAITEVEDFTVDCGEISISATQTQICSGQSTTLSLTLGNVPGTYQWYRNGTPILNATGFSLATTQTGIYTLRYQNGTCADTSDALEIGVGSSVNAVITPSGPTALCATTTVTLNATTGNGFTHQWLLNGDPISGQTTSQLANLGTVGSYAVVVTNATGCKDTSEAVTVSVEPGTGDPSVFPQDSWNLYAYSGPDLNLGNTTRYRGFYSINSLNIRTQDQWSAGESPSSASGYQGCVVPPDNFTFVVKRKGFPSGPYLLTIPEHDDNILVLLNGTNIYSAGCCSTNPTLTLGGLDQNSTLEIRVVEGGGFAFLQFNLSLSGLQPGTISGNQTLCNGGTPAAFVNTQSAFGGSTTSISYQWQDSTSGGTWQDISGATIATFQPGVLSASRWYRRKAINGAEQVFSNEIQVSVVEVAGDPAVFPQGSWNLYAYSGTDINLGAGNLYRGFYSVNSLNVNTNDQWSAGGSSPSAAPGYQGCPVPVDNFTFVLKRKGFAPGSYLLNMPNHDDHVQILVNGNLIFEHLSCCDAHTGIDLGNLDANSTVEVRTVEFSGFAQMVLEFQSSAFQGGEIAAAQTICSGSVPALLTSLSPASGGTAGNPSYIWQDSTAGGSWQDITGAQGLTFQPGSLSQNRWFRRKATAGNFSALSNEVAISVFAQPTVTVSPSQPPSLCEGEILELTASVSNGASVRWLRDGQVMAAQVSSSLFVSQSGNYQAIATVGGICSDTSGSVTVQFNPKPAPQTNLTGPQSICANGSLVLTLTNPQPGQTNQWKRDAEPIQGGNSITVSQPGFYYVVSTVTATGCRDSSSGVTLNVVDPVVSPTGPVSICEGGSSTLTLTQSGNGTISWLKNNQLISGASGSTLSVSEAGMYKAIVVLGSLCTDTSNVVQVTVNSLPAASIFAEADSFCVGGSTVLRANTGAGLTYQWKRNGSNLTNATADTLLVSQPGDYSVEVRNSFTCSRLSDVITIRSVNNLSWFTDVDGDGYGTGATISSCSRPQNGFLAGELTATTGDCNDLDATINPARQFFSFAGTSGYESALCSPLQGTPYTTFRFEVLYTDLNNNPPPVTFPRVILDYEGNGQLNGSNDRTILMQQADSKDQTYSDGKRYFASVNSLPSGQNYTTRVVSNIGTCGALSGPFPYPDVFILSDLQIFANDITFDNLNPAVSSPLEIKAVVHNVSDFAAQNFVVHLRNQFDTTIVYPDIVVPFLAPHSSTTVTWNITTPDVPAWCPMQVYIDWTNIISETNELDNSAIRPFVNGNFNVPGAITTGPSVVPSTVVGVSGASVTLTGTATYTGTAVPLQDPSVAGAQVTFTVQPGGQTFTTYTNAQGQINFNFPVGTSPGIYTVTGTITDFTLTATFTTTFTVVPPVCLPDLVAFMSVSSTNIVEGESITGSIRIRNGGCQAATDSTTLKFTQSGGTPTLVNVRIPPLAVGEFFDVSLGSLLFSTPGVFSICGLADGDFEITESAEFNNQDCEIISVIPLLPDIFPTTCGVGGQAFLSGQPSTIGFSLSNSGGSATGPFNVRVIIRKDGTPVDTVNQLISNLGRQSSTSFSFQYTYPSAGTYSFSVFCDTPEPNGVVAETNEDNNGNSCSIVILNPLADLYFTGGCENLDVDPNDPAFPGNVTLRARVINGGNAPAAAPILVRFTQSGGAVHEVTLDQDLAAGQSVLVTKTVPSVAPATETVSAVVDPNNTIPEFFENNNNVGPKDLCHEFAPVDNVCGLSWWNGNYLINQAIFLWVPVAVGGAYDASQLKVRFFVSGPGLSGTLNLGDAILTNVSETCGCPVAATLPVSFAFPQEGDYTFTFVTDPDGQYTECNENNNTLVRTVKVSGLPDMRVLSQGINPSKLNPDVNEPISIDVNYENIGMANIDQTMKIKLLVDEVPVDSAQVNGLVNGDNFTVNFNTPWSSDIVGAHIIRTIIDADQQVEESNEANNEATRAVIVGAAANLYFQAFLPSNSSPTLGQNITVTARIGNNGDEDVEGIVQLFYINNQNDTIQIGQLPVAVGNQDSVTLSFPWTVVDNNTTLIGKIVNANIMEFNYDDNTATAPVGLFTVTLSSTPSCAGKPNGSLFPTVSGGTGPFSYLWSTGFTGDSLVSGPGLYSLTVTDANSVSVQVTGSIPNIPGVRYFRDADSDGYGNPLIDSVDCFRPEGFVRDSSDCNDANPTLFKKTTPPLVSVTGNRTFCLGDSVVLSTTPVSGRTYTWSNDSIGNQLVVYSSGTYFVTVGGDSVCPSTSSSVQVSAVTSITPTAQVTGSPGSPICTGTPVTFSASITGGGIQPAIEWYLNNVFVQDGLQYQTDTLRNNDEVMLILTSSESCADPVLVFSNKITMSVQNSIAANAGPDQTVCGSLTALNATGTGFWRRLSGTGVLSDSTSPNASVSTLSAGENRFRWEQTAGTCPPSADTMSVFSVLPPNPANAGPDQTVCDTLAVLAAGVPQIGTGVWRVVSGGAFLSDSTSATSLLRNLSVGSHALVWTVKGNPVCPSSTDTVVITRQAPPDPANAGPDQVLCADQTQLAATSPASGAGVWKLLTGSGILSDSLAANSLVTDLGTGINQFLWRISGGSCGTTQDTVSIQRDALSAPAIAGPDQVVCDTLTTLAAVPSGQSGVVSVWRVLQGSASFTDSTRADAVVSGFSPGVNALVWTLTFGVCPSSSDTVFITRLEVPGPASAGTDQNLCATTATLAGNTPASGTGVWSVLTGSGILADSLAPGTAVSGLGLGLNQLVWSVSNACGIARDTVRILREAEPGTALAGPDQTVCDSTATLAANLPQVGTSSWSVAEGSGIFSNPAQPDAEVEGLIPGRNVFVWTLSNGVCPASTDTVVVFRQTSPGPSNAGEDQTLCADATTMGAVAPSVGAGVWRRISGTGVLSDSTSASTAVTGLGEGANLFSWTLSNGLCPSVSDTVSLMVNPAPSPANAGQDQTVCDTTTSLFSNVPFIGSGSWSVLSGGGNIPSPGQANAILNGIGVGENLLVWTISSPGCEPSRDTVRITRVARPDGAVAGPDQILCSDQTVLAGNTPGVGTAAWQRIAGSGQIQDSLNPVSAVTGLSVGNNRFVWTIRNGICPSRSDTVLIVRQAAPAPANAGPDQVVCGQQTAFAAVPASAGTGTWRRISGTGTVADSLNPLSSVSGLIAGTSEWVWIVRNGVCPASSDTVRITANPAPVADAGPSRITCTDTARIQAEAVSLPALGTWTRVSGGGTLADTSLASTTVSNLPVGVSVFRWTVTSPGCPPSTDTMQVLRIPDTFSIGNDTTLCADSAFTINLGNLYTFVVWQDGSTLPTYTIDTAGVYHVTVTTATNCVFSDTLVVSLTTCTSVDPRLGSAARVSVHPNPFRSSFHIEVDEFSGGEVPFSLYTPNGVKVLSDKAYGSRGQVRKEIFPGALPQGMYILELHLGQRTERIKLVMQ